MSLDILIIDDEADIRRLISGILEDEGYHTRQADNSKNALDLIAQKIPSMIILDIWLQDSPMDGMQLLSLIHHEYPELPIVMISGHGNIETAVNSLRQGAYDFIEKPFKTDHLLLVVSRCMEHAKLRMENTELKLKADDPQELTGASNLIVQLRQAILKIAPTGSRVLITGPAGAGKELVAKLIHRHSKRAAAPFVVLNCALIKPDKLEIELFGRKSTNGHVSSQVGLLEKANGGTILLDEIADMPLETQAKMVRVLQEQFFERVGGQGQRVEADVRIIASTAKNIEHEIEKKRFRQDLFYRLNVITIHVPGLKERREDILPLASVFIERAMVAGLAQRLLSPETSARLQAYEWPGNVRQLRNVIEHLLILSQNNPDDSISADMLPAYINRVGPASLDKEGTEEIMSLPLREARELFEKQYLNAQVNRFGGNISKTAHFIGMERSALHRKLKSLGLGQLDR